MDQRGQAGAALDPAVLPRLPGQRGAPAAVRAGLQPGQLPALTRAARPGRAVVAHDLAREARQDRRPDHAPRPLPGLPARRGGGAARPVRRDPAPDRPLARTARCGGLTGANRGWPEPRGELCAEVREGTRAARSGCGPGYIGSPQQRSAPEHAF